MSIPPHAVNWRQCSTTRPWVSIFIRLAPWQSISPAPCVWAALSTWNPAEHEWETSLEASSCKIVSMVGTVSSAFIESVSHLVKIGATGFKCQWTTLRSVQNILRVHRRINDVSNNTSTAGFLTIPKQALPDSRQCEWTVAWFLLQSPPYCLQLTGVVIGLASWIPSSWAVANHC